MKLHKRQSILRAHGESARRIAYSTFLRSTSANLHIMLQNTRHILVVIRISRHKDLVNHSVRVASKVDVELGKRIMILIRVRSTFQQTNKAKIDCRIGIWYNEDEKS